MKPLIPFFQLASIDVLGLALSVPGLMTVLGCALGAVAALRAGRRHGLPGREFLHLFPWLFFSLAIGSHLGSLLLYSPGWLVERPSALFHIWEGESSVGAIGLAIVCVAVFLRLRRAPLQERAGADAVLRYADALVLGASLGWLIGRLGCIAVHDHPGVESDFWLAIVGICAHAPAAAACHDLGLEEALICFACLVGLAWLQRRPSPAGWLTYTMGGTYGASRFLLDFLRDPLGDSRYLGLTPAQYGGVALALLSWRGFMRLHRQRCRNLSCRTSEGRPTRG